MAFAYLTDRGAMSYDPGNARINRMVGGPSAPRLLDEVRRVLRLKHYSIRTETVYVAWVRRFILANGKRHPRDMGEAEVEGFLSGLAVQGKVAATTQNQALAALLFLYKQVLGIELPWMTIQTAELPPVPGYGSDWRDEKVRELDLKKAFRRDGGMLKLDLEVRKKSVVPHSRVLKLTYPNGRRLNLKFDQGVDYWTMVGLTVSPKYPRGATDVTAWFD